MAKADPIISTVHAHLPLIIAVKAITVLHGPGALRLRTRAGASATIVQTIVL